MRESRLADPLRDCRSQASTPSGSVSKVLIPNLPRADVPPWALEMLKIAVAASDFPVEPGLQVGDAARGWNCAQWQLS